ncbi:MAG: hypothetical protein HRU19_11860 [Pseudobacteriovorax sp.]|nr:hypothetical protein [Pseudobacteriovorax sp.]
MKLYCRICDSHNTPSKHVVSLCTSCLLSLSSPVGQKKLQLLRDERQLIQVDAFGYYEGALRDLIVNAKRYGCSYAIDVIWNVLLRVIPWSIYAKNIVAVCPISSSLWSRAKGRCNLAAVVSHRISERLTIPILNLRGRGFYSLKKRSYQSSAERQRLCEYQLSESPIRRGNERESVLIVDDVITTGYTIGSLVESFSQFNFKGMTIAHAIHRIDRAEYSRKPRKTNSYDAPIF